MAEIMTEHPFVDDDGYLYYNLIKHYARGENGAKYSLIQNETGESYDDPIDVFPCKYTYSLGNEVVEESSNGENIVIAEDDPKRNE